MMRIEIEHRFEGAILSDVEQLYMLDDDFNRVTFEQLGFQRKVVAAKRSGRELERTLWLCPLKSLPRPFASLIPGGVFHVVEHIRYDFAAHRGTWLTQPSVLASQFRAEGTFELSEVERGVVFRMRGEAHASLSLLSGRAERQAVATAEQQHAALAEAVRGQLAAAHALRSGAFVSA